jgi:hypothetical protein
LLLSVVLLFVVLLFVVLLFVVLLFVVLLPVWLLLHHFQNPRLLPFGCISRSLPCSLHEIFLPVLRYVLVFACLSFGDAHTATTRLNIDC